MVPPGRTGGASMVTRVVGHIAIVVHTADAPTADEWQDWLRQVREVPPERLAILVFSDGGHPDVNQRATLEEMFAVHKPRVAVVLTGALARHALTAISWFNPLIRPFRPGQGAAALDYLGVPRAEQPALMEQVHECAAALSSPLQALSAPR
jgi:hypothetical protein